MQIVIPQSEEVVFPLRSIQNAVGHECSICRNDFEQNDKVVGHADRIGTLWHFVHKECLKKWSLHQVPPSIKTARCAVCRQNVNVRPLFRLESFCNTLNILRRHRGVRSSAGSAAIIGMLGMAYRRNDFSAKQLFLLYLGLVGFLLKVPGLEEIDTHALVMGELTVFLAILSRKNITGLSLDILMTLVAPITVAMFAMIRVIRN